MRATTRALGFALAATFLLPACGDDSTGPGGGGAPDPALSNIWPHEDGRSWTYSFDQVAVDSTGIRLYAERDSVPPAPDVAEVAALLAEALPPGETASSVGAYRLKFDGQQTTASGATGQRLRETIFHGAARGRGAGIEPEPWPQRLAALASGGTRLDHLPVTEVEAPMLLFGYAWEQTPEHIGTYGDLDQLLAWKFLEADLSVGHRFTHRLVPALAADVYLHALVAERGSVPSEVALHPKAVTVHYLVDYGVVRRTDEGGSTLGYARPLTYGHVVYAPGVGPVAMYERSEFPFPGDLVPGGSGLTIDKELVLIGTGLDPDQE